MPPFPPFLRRRLEAHVLIKSRALKARDTPVLIKTARQAWARRSGQAQRRQELRDGPRHRRLFERVSKTEETAFGTRTREQAQAEGQAEGGSRRHRDDGIARHC